VLTTSAPENKPNYTASFVRKEVFATVIVAVMSQITYVKPSGWKAHRAPNWFYPGIARYFGMMHSSGNNGIVEPSVEEQKYLEQLRAHPEGIARVLKSPDGNSQAELVIPARFILETYGMEKIRKLLLSQEPSFWQAAQSELNLSPESLYENFYPWLTGSPAPPLPTPPAPEAKDF
jgi:hypothetical protein